MATRAKKKGWFITAVVLAGVAIAAAFNSDKVKEWVAKVPMLNDMLTKK
ncbi:hypothetical protein [Flavivirga sp. 57AJ16]|nr:hypothetical protein [Flavivirga sp. 57AJ16]MDD7885742.1 hypothetical protein [Flavivirga sp. 57AJ16]